MNAKRQHAQTNFRKVTQLIHRPIGQAATTLLLSLTMLLTSFENNTQAQGCTRPFDAAFEVNQLSGSKARFSVIFNKKGAYHSSGTSQTWYFGDGTVIADTNIVDYRGSVTHQYDSAGQYKVCHVVDSGNCYDSTCKQVNITCGTASVQVKGNGFQRNFSAKNTANSYSWDFGDGSTSTKANPTHTYSNTGTYQVTLIANGSNNCTDTQTKQVTIRCKADAGFRVQGNGFQRTFKPDTTANSYSWDFGDGSTSTKANPTHTYSDTGTYQVTLIANGSICTDTQTKQVTIRCKADAGYTISSFDNERDFDANTRANSASSTYHWDFGDGSTDSGAYVRNTYSRKDTYDVQLVVKDGPGCADTNTRQVVIGNSNRIDGRIALQQRPATRVDSLLVKLYHYDSCKGVYNKIRSYTTKDSGRYRFDTLPPGKFHVKADPSRDSNLSGKYVATYHKKATHWSNADSIVMSGLGKFKARNDITLQKATNTSGSGNITGYVGGSKANCTNKKQPADGALANIPVLLLNKNREPVDRTTTDQNGNYDFGNLALSTYYVQVDLPGYQAEVKKVNLTSDKAEKQVEFNVDGPQVKVEQETAGIKEAAPKATVKVYPRPAGSQVNLEISNLEAEQVTLNITNLNGQLMGQQRIGADKGPQTVQLNVSQWPAGAYILKLQDQHGQVQAVRKLMVR